MGRELKRVPLDFDWPLNEPWRGYLNPHHVATKCAACDGDGGSPAARHLRDLWYGHASFRPEDRGSVPLTPDSPPVRRFAERNVGQSPNFYGTGERAIVREAERLCRLWNAQWCHHLNADDVAALDRAGRLHELGTCDFVKGEGWVRRAGTTVPTPTEVNAWSIGGFGHDWINYWACVKAECERLGQPTECSSCDGHGELWPSPEARARHMATTRWGSDDGTPYATWLAFVRRPGWAPSGIILGGRMVTGVECVVALMEVNQ